MKRIMNNGKAIPTSTQQALCLALGPWKDYVPAYKRNTLLAEALNYCVLHKKLKIQGYLIEASGLSLILNISEDTLPALLQSFRNWVADAVMEELAKTLPHYQAEEGESIPTVEELTHPLFQKLPLENLYLIKLLTGKEVKMEYYDPEIARLKDIVRKATYCSAVDYAGAEGPVLLENVKRSSQNYL